MSVDPNPVAYTCTCPCQTETGTVLLFYRYFAAPPSLLSTVTPAQLVELQTFHKSHVTSHSLGCKIRLSEEGFNITIGGSSDAIQSYITACLSHWSFAGLPLSTPQEIDDFFKPSPGCACVFAGRQDVLVKSEITPLGVTGWLPRDWEIITELSPPEWHRRAAEEDVVMVDVRNHYESRLGHFVGRNGPTLLPAIRRFGQWPAYVKKMISEGTLDGQGAAAKSVFTYCTGGIRCEKGARWLAEEMHRSGSVEADVYTLRGGIAAYLSWTEEEITAGRMQTSDSLFKGRNYVFDARGSLGLNGGEKVATCHGCGKAEDQMEKCASPGCYLVLVVCKECMDIRCCEDCRGIELRQAKNVAPRPMCECERSREAQLWGPEKPRKGKGQGKTTMKWKDHILVERSDKPSIKIKIREGG
jgi:predicted sulfurtransferase